MSGGRGPARRRAMHGTALALLLVCAAACGGPRPPDGAPAEPPVAADPAVQRLLVDACYPCHATSAAPPWYGRLAPSSWTTSARVVLDFSEWANYPPARRTQLMHALAAVVSGGSMPPGDYTFFDGAAKLDEAQRQALVRWAAAPAPSATP